MSVQETIRYGAAELKRIYNRNLGLALGISVGFHLLLIGLYIFGANLGKASDKKGPLVSGKVRLVNIAPPEETAPPPMVPPELMQLKGTGGVASVAGTPVPVPDAVVTPDMKEFATTKEIMVATPQGGDGTGFGGLENGIAAPINVPQQVNVKDKEDEPAPDEFIPDATEPTFDYDALKNRVVYPELAKRNGVEGKVIVRVLVDKTGRPKKTLIDYSDNKILERAAVDAVMATSFSPAIQNKNPIAVWVSIPVEFKLH